MSSAPTSCAAPSIGYRCIVDCIVGSRLSPLEVLLGELVGELVEEVGTPVVLKPLGVERVEQALERGMWHRTDAVQEDVADVVDRSEQLRGLFREPTMHHITAHTLRM